MDSTQRRPVFCTACGERLEDFCFSPEAKDIDAVRAHAFRCLLEGRRISGMCAALYIVDDAHPAQPAGSDAPSARPADPDGAQIQQINEESLRRAILARIAREGDAPPDESPPGRAPSAQPD